MMIKPNEFRTLVDYYKGKISESTLLDKAVRVAAEAQTFSSHDCPWSPSTPHQRRQDGWVTRKTVERIGKIHKCQCTIHRPLNHPNTFDGKEGGAKA